MKVVDRLIYTNSRKECIEFSSKPPFKIMGIDGLGGLDNNIHTVKSPYQHGTSIVNTNTDPRRIIFDILILESNIKEKRREISKVLNPTLGMGTLQYIYSDGEIKEIECEVETAPTFPSQYSSMPSERFQRTQFTLFCPSPFWCNIEESEEMKAFINLFKFPLTFPTQMGSEGCRVTINNEGDIPTPIKITFKGAAINPRIINMTTGKFIKVNRELKANDILTIDTTFGNKRVEINDENAYFDISFDSKLFELAIGENILTYETDSGARDAIVEIRWKNKYVGI